MCINVVPFVLNTHETSDKPFQLIRVHTDIPQKLPKNQEYGVYFLLVFKPITTVIKSHL